MFHALQYLMGNQSLEQLQKFRSYGGIQSYPSRTKDKVDVDFSTGSVGLGATITSFAAYCQDWLLFKGPEFAPHLCSLDKPSRLVSLIGDAELDEGNVFEGLIESWKHNFRNNWFIVDYNRQSLDKVSFFSSLSSLLSLLSPPLLLHILDCRGGQLETDRQNVSLTGLGGEDAEVRQTFASRV